MDERAQLFETVLTRAVGFPVQVGAERWVLYRLDGWWYARQADRADLWRLCASTALGDALDVLASDLPPWFRVEAQQAEPAEDGWARRQG